MQLSMKRSLCIPEMRTQSAAPILCNIDSSVPCIPDDLRGENLAFPMTPTTETSTYTSYKLRQRRDRDQGLFDQKRLHDDENGDCVPERRSQCLPMQDHNRFVDNSFPLKALPSNDKNLIRKLQLPNDFDDRKTNDQRPMCSLRCRRQTDNAFELS
eukprot:CAMPEP_0172443236 /NCGR_PEP_ID=MMETSP1065-20121228/3540_1 /TAXON_ID=265537 /ORGANISM="Amphiprora paludosa, Strain CCMP125" /LENGTH=155 /DNA_ID=CAMNT_0013193403 /DNA_START=33 /DNA_END=497 /DNA_ORIENTATION=+